MQYINKYTIAAGLAIVSVIIYLYLHYNRHCNIEAGNTLYVVAGTVFTVVLYTILFVEVTALDASELGRLKDEKPTVVLGLTFIIVFSGYELLSVFYNLTKLPMKAC
ncbi:MAG TPA: hypothetical protein VG100_09045 [Xanthobacteraceae bacterium]|jgi:hypothetical protein|nr:hypothetical protein [Xanthobacteraceae bacterium]